MTEGAATTIWARAFADELARCGVQDVVIAPGSRSTPLVMAFAQDGRFRMRVHLDERSGAFFALGLAKASGGDHNHLRYSDGERFPSRNRGLAQ